MTTARKKAVTVVLGYPQPKKNVTRFDATDEDAAMSSAYVSKAALAELGDPAKIRVTIEAVA